MKPTQKKLLSEWNAQAGYRYNGSHFIIDHDEQIPGIIVKLDRLVSDLANSKKALFVVRKTKQGDRLHPVSELGKRVLECVDNLRVPIVRQYLTRHRFSPYFELWEEYDRELEQAVWYARHAQMLEGLNRCIEAIRIKARESSFRAVVRNQERSARKNWAGLQSFIHKVFAEDSRLLVVRVDLGYRSDPVEFGFNWQKPEDSKVKKDLKQILSFISRKVPNRLGHVWKLEYGASKGHHVHCLILIDGHLSQKGFPIAKMIGEKWEAITGNGSYWNCNGSEALFKRRGQLGIGLIDYSNKEARENLMNVALYVAKADYYARFISPDIGRTFGKSLVKVSTSSKRRGRPRKYVDPVEGIDETKQVNKVKKVA